MNSTILIRRLPADFLSRLMDQFWTDETVRLAAALAFYTALSFAPLLMLFVTVAAGIDPALQASFTREVSNLIGAEGGQLVNMIIASSKQRPDLTSIAGFLGGVTLVLSASLIFGELKYAMNRIFRIPAPPVSDEPVWRQALDFLRLRVAHVGIVLSFIFMLIVSLAMSSIVTQFVNMDDHSVAVGMNLVSSFVFYAFAFTLMIRYLPDLRQSWRTSFRGGTLTALLFLVGKEFIGIYLGRSAVGSAYGAAGALIVVLVWVYYSALIILIGAQACYLMSSRATRTPDFAPEKVVEAT